MPDALVPPTGPVHFIDRARIDAGIAASRVSPRKRVIVPIHRRNSDHAQRMLNIIQPGSYVRPHLHPQPQVGVELVCVLKGAALFVIFEENGDVAARHILRPGPDSSVGDIEAGVYHSFCALEADTVILEIKGGPYHAELDKLWPDWAPPEQSPQAQAYLKGLLAGIPGS